MLTLKEVCYTNSNHKIIITSDNNFEIPKKEHIEKHLYFVFCDENGGSIRVNLETFCIHSYQIVSQENLFLASVAAGILISELKHFQEVRTFSFQL